jgi:hypothetical protein
MKKLTLTLTLGMGLAASSYAQGNFIFDNTANAGQANVVPFIGAQGKATEGAVGATLGSDSTHATPNYDLSYAWIAGQFNAGDPTKALGVTFSDQVFSMLGQIGDDANGAGFVSGTGSIPSSTVTDGTVVQMEILAWYDPTGTTTFMEAYNGGNNVGWSAPISIRLISGVDTAGQDITAMQGFSVQPVPEPATFALAGLGAAALMIFRRRK